MFRLISVCYCEIVVVPFADIRTYLLTSMELSIFTAIEGAIFFTKLHSSFFFIIHSKTDNTRRRGIAGRRNRLDFFFYRHAELIMKIEDAVCHGIEVIVVKITDNKSEIKAK